MHGGRATKQLAGPAYAMAATSGHYSNARERRPEKIGSAGVLFVFRRGGVYYGKGFPLDGGALQLGY